MKNETYRRCSNCGKMSLNEDYCPACGNIINITLKRELERTAKEKQRDQQRGAKKKKNRISIFFEKAKNHDNIIIKSLAHFFYSIWVVVIAIGSFLALVFGYIAA